jgi:hypothetical protein
MDQENTAATPEPWQRLTLIDILILFVSHALAGGLIGRFLCGEILAHLPHLDTLDYLAIAAGLACVVIMGGLFSLPMIYFVQFVFRRRRKGIAGGEIEAVVAILFLGFAALAHSSFSDRATLGWDIAAVFILFLLIAEIASFCRFIATRRRAPCPWLSLYGHAFGFVSWTGFILLVVVVNMILDRVFANVH